jgi:hypothetical protein
MLEAVVRLATEIILIGVDLGVHPYFRHLGSFPDHISTSQRLESRLAPNAGMMLVERAALVKCRSAAWSLTSDLTARV